MCIFSAICMVNLEKKKQKEKDGNHGRKWGGLHCFSVFKHVHAIDFNNALGRDLALADEYS